MNANRSLAFLSLLLCILSLAWRVSPADGTEADELARAIASDPGVRPGLWVQLGVGDGALTAALSLDGRNTVHGLSGDPDRCARVRGEIIRQGRYGNIAVGLSD